MSRLPRVTGKALIQLLQKEGYRLSHVRGSHHYLRKPDVASLVVIPVHGNRQLPVGTLISILRQAGIEPADFEKLLGRS